VKGDEAAARAGARGDARCAEQSAIGWVAWKDARRGGLLAATAAAAASREPPGVAVLEQDLYRLGRRWSVAARCAAGATAAARLRHIS
jgi:hypothetical protein